MLLWNAWSLVDDRDPHGVPLTGRAYPDFGAVGPTTVTDGVGEKILEQLDQLVEVARNIGEVRVEFGPQLATARIGHKTRVGDRRVQDICHAYDLGGPYEPIGVEPREAHQILDDPKHSLRLVTDGAREARAKLLWKLFGIGKGLRIADDRR